MAVRGVGCAYTAGESPDYRAREGVLRNGDIGRRGLEVQCMLGIMHR